MTGIKGWFEGFSISDKTKLRLAGILRSRINPPAEVDVEIVNVWTTKLLLSLSKRVRETLAP